MDRYKVFPSGEMGMHPAGNWTPYADAQATVEALRAQLPAEMQECTILFKECEKGHGRLTATNWIDHGCQTCAMEALQRERDEARRKYHEAMDIMSAWKNIDHAEAVARLLEANKALDAERELSAAWAEKAREYELELYGDPQNFHGRGRTIGVREHLSQLQALVRALPVVRIDLNGACHDTLLAQPEDDAVKELLRYRATLDATTPAPDTSIIGKCEPPSQWDPNAQVRGDIS